MFSTHVLLYCARFFTADQNPHVRSSWSRKKKELRTRWNRWLINTGYIRIDPRDGSRRGGERDARMRRSYDTLENDAGETRFKKLQRLSQERIKRKIHSFQLNFLHGSSFLFYCPMWKKKSKKKKKGKMNHARSSTKENRPKLEINDGKTWRVVTYTYVAYYMFTCLIIANRAWL